MDDFQTAIMKNAADNGRWFCALIVALDVALFLEGGGSAPLISALAAISAVGSGYIADAALLRLSLRPTPWVAFVQKVFSTASIGFAIGALGFTIGHLGAR